MSDEGVLQCLEARIESTLLAKCSDPAFKLFGRTIPVLSSSESTEKSYESNDSCDVEKIIQKISSSDDEKSSFSAGLFPLKRMSSDDEKSSVCVQKSSEGNLSSVDEKSSIGAEKKSQEKNLNDSCERDFERKNLHDKKSNIVGESLSQNNNENNNDEKSTVGGEKYFQTKKMSDEKSSIGKQKKIPKNNLKDEKSNIVGGKKNQKRILNDEKSSFGAETNGVTDGSEEISGNDDEVPKKPNKLLPCPRCESMDTKFCYYNNYNVNQPRHFCRNCQRYWTAGGLLRNVPVGAGRRKNKHSAMTHQRNLVADSRVLMGHGQDCPSGNSEESIKIEVSDLEMTGFGQVFHDVKSVGKGMGAFVGLESCTVLPQDNESFQKLSCSSNQNGCEKREIFQKPSCSSDQMSHDKGGEPGEFQPLNVSVSASSGKKSSFIKSEIMEPCESNKSQLDNGGSYELPNKADSMSWANGSSPIWPLYYNSSLYGNASYMNGIGGAALSPEAARTNSMMPWFQPAAGLCPGFPWLFPSRPMWGQARWVPAWRMALSPVAPMSASSDSCPSMLGKHTRDAVAPQSDSKCDGSLWVPKTLRIDDPGEAAKSSIWAALGLGSKPESITSGGIFKAFQAKTHNTDNSKASVQVLCANPAASTISASFNEST